MEGDGYCMAKHRLWSTVLFLGFGAYLFLCIGLQIMLFKQYASGFQGAGHISYIPFAAVVGAWGGHTGSLMPLRMWFQLAGLMIPFGFCLFLWVEDCTSFRSIALITLGFSGVLCGTNYLLTAPAFDIDFMAASLCGAFVGYSTAVIFVEVLFSQRIPAMLNSSPTRYKKVA